MILPNTNFKWIWKVLIVMNVIIITLYVSYTHLQERLKFSDRGPTNFHLQPEDKVVYRNLTPCPVTPPNLVKDTKPRLDIIDWRTQEKRHVELQPGGRWAPTHCISSNHVAILVPYRARDEHLHIFINNIHDYLQKQELLYGIYIVEQAGNDSFNRGKLLNIGFSEAMKDHNWGCAVLHDVDHLPTNENNLYTCQENHPRHLSVSVSKYHFKLVYETYVGGVTILPSDMYKKINGMSNMYWGWGGEDDDLYKRCSRKKFLPLLRYSADVGKYLTIEKYHKSAPASPQRFMLLKQTSNLQDHDGLNNINYKIIKKEYRNLYTYILADIGHPPPK